MIIPVYKAEVDLGLAEAVRASACISYASEILPANKEVISPIDVAKAKEIVGKAFATNENQFDLYYLNTILVTVGWNKNDDVFDKKEVWVARYTPEDKPFNIEHDPRRVRGHITGNYVIRDDNSVIPDNVSIDDLPTKYHVVTSAVLYKFLKSPDEDLVKEMETIIAEIKDGKWYVSMECLFANFDYAVTTASGKTTVVPRNEESAFLTKHLRAYGGDGTYENHKIGRLLRNIVFSGKGLVRRPANPESIIFRDVANFQVTSSKEFQELQTQMGYKSVSDNNSIKESIRMPDTNTAEVTVLQSQLKTTESTLATVTKKNEELEKRLNELNEKQVQAKFDDLNNQVKTRDEKITSLDTQVKAEQKARTEAEDKLAKANEKLAQLEAELNKVNLEKTKATRVAAWVERTGAETAVATKAVEKLVKLSDDEFKDFLETQPAKATQTPPPAKPAEEKGKASGSQNADTKKLENVEKPNDPPLASGGVDTGTEQTRASLGKFIKKNFLKNSNNNSTDAKE